MSNSEASSESDIALQPPTQSKPKTGKKNKKAPRPKTTETAHGRNEGTDPDLAYSPPPGAVLVDHSVDIGEFDWDTIQDDEDLELWVIRVPQGLKPKHLQDIKLDSPSSSKDTCVATIDRKNSSYDVWSLGDSPPSSVGGEEVRRLSCLLPRKSKGGKLFQAPRPVARHLVVTAKPTQPTLGEDTSRAESPLIHKNPPRPRYPLEALKHRFTPLGSLAPTGSTDAINVDDTSGDQPMKPQASEEPAKKRRKGDGESRKKSKKTKVAASQ